MALLKGWVNLYYPREIQTRGHRLKAVSSLTGLVIEEGVHSATRMKSLFTWRSAFFEDCFCVRANSTEVGESPRLTRKVSKSRFSFPFRNHTFSSPPTMQMTIVDSPHSFETVVASTMSHWWTSSRSGFHSGRSPEPSLSAEKSSRNESSVDCYLLINTTSQGAEYLVARHESHKWTGQTRR